MDYFRRPPLMTLSLFHSRVSALRSPIQAALAFAAAFLMAFLMLAEANAASGNLLKNSTSFNTGPWYAQASNLIRQDHSATDYKGQRVAATMQARPMYTGGNLRQMVALK